MTVNKKNKNKELNNNEISQEATEIIETVIPKDVEESVETSSIENPATHQETDSESKTTTENTTTKETESSVTPLETKLDSDETSKEETKEENLEDNSNSEIAENTTSQNNEKENTEEPNFEKVNDENIFQNTNTKKISHLALKIFQNVVLTTIAIIVLAFTVFTIANTDNSKISSGISIWGVDMSKLNKDEATEKLSNFVQEKLQNNIILKHNEYETNIGLEQLEVKVKVSEAIDSAFEAGSRNNIFSNSFTKLALLIKPVDIHPTIKINTEQLEKTLSDISTQLPDAVKQSSYYIDGNNLIVTSGKTGVIVDTSTMKDLVITKINDLSYINNPIEIATLSKEPDAPNIDNIYNEIHKEPIDAHFDANTRIVYPEENGLDLNISLDEAKQMLTVAQEEYNIPLKVLHPNVTTNMIGMEAFPDLLSTFSTKYAASNAGRTTNLKLAAGKINGTVILPGQTFSYNSVVGARTIAAGYKEAAIYQDGQVVNGLGGGICQISTTLYNAALYANLDIVERRNHQFVPSYIGAGRDATVVYGSQDFKFKNNRNYAIKLTCSVDRGIASFNIYGINEPNDYEVVISSSITSRGANYLTSATYKTLKQNGAVVSSETIARDTYKLH